MLVGKEHFLPAYCAAKFHRNSNGTFFAHSAHTKTQNDRQTNLRSCVVCPEGPEGIDAPEADNTILAMYWSYSELTWLKCYFGLTFVDAVTKSILSLRCEHRRTFQFR